MLPLKRTATISNVFYGFFVGEENIAKMIILGRVSRITKEPLKVKYKRNQSMRERSVVFHYQLPQLSKHSYQLRMKILRP